MTGYEPVLKVGVFAQLPLPEHAFLNAESLDKGDLRTWRIP
jgi:hypothetical protein